MMNNFEIFIRTHRATTIIFFAPNNMNFTHIKRIGSTNNGTDIEIVGPVFDGDFIRVSAAGVKISFDCRHGPVSVTVEHVAAVAFVEQGYITDFDYSPGFSTDVVTTPHSHTQEYFDEVIEKFHGTQFVLLKDFGSISVADNVDNALNYLAWMEEVCQKIVRAEMIGDIQWIDE